MQICVSILWHITTSVGRNQPSVDQAASVVLRSVCVIFHDRDAEVANGKDGLGFLFLFFFLLMLSLCNVASYISSRVCTSCSRFQLVSGLEVNMGCVQPRLPL